MIPTAPGQIQINSQVVLLVSTALKGFSPENPNDMRQSRAVDQESCRSLLKHKSKLEGKGLHEDREKEFPFLSFDRVNKSRVWLQEEKTCE